MDLVTLQHNRPVRFAGATRIECVRGIVWLTRTGGAGDHFLRPGDSCVLAGSDAALVEALGQAQIQLRRAPSPWRRPLARVAGVLSSLHERMRTLRVERRGNPLAG